MQDHPFQVGSQVRFHAPPFDTEKVYIVQTTMTFEDGIPVMQLLGEGPTWFPASRCVLASHKIKRPIAFCYEEAENCWCPLPKDIHSVLDLPSYQDGDDTEIRIKVRWMTDAEFAALPED